MSGRQIKERLKRFREEQGKAFDAAGTNLRSTAHPVTLEAEKEREYNAQVAAAQALRKQQHVDAQQRDPSLVRKSRRQVLLERGLQLVLWLLLFALSVHLELAAIFVLASAFVGIYLTLADNRGKRRKGELSAYSVFNEGLEKIDGTLDANQFEKELRYGPGAT